MEPMRVPAAMFRFTDGDRAGLYIAILHGFNEANDRLETALGLEEIRARLRSVGWLGALDDAELVAGLRQLFDWGLVDVVQNHAENYRTAVEYERRNLQYSLTRKGEAAFAGVAHAMTVLASTGALQTAVLDAIGDRLGDLISQLEVPASPDRRVFGCLMELESHLEALRTNTRQFNGELQRLLRGGGADMDTFYEVKSATVAYLEEFLTNLDQRARTIATRIDHVERLGVDSVWHRALLGAELPRLGDDPGPAWTAQRKARWEGLRSWFAPSDGSTPRVEQLHRVARRSIVTLLQALERIVESRRRATSAVADFRELARWFDALPTEADLHRLWTTAFGLSSARHAHLGHDDPELVSPGTMWADAPAVEVSPLLRSTGRIEKFARTGRVRDVAALRAARAAAARAERAELEAAWDLLATDGPVALSAFGHLDHPVFERLLDLLGRALSSGPASDGVRRAATSDGRIEIVLRPPADRSTATITTPRGRFSCPDYRVDIASAGRRRAPRPVEEVS